ncbi:TnsD family Tn7-like transposition protein [Neobacillus sp. PS3-34]|uniref:TnsD family Tn7-like transposition protein n=1 Tax=Neobacillus sp. PS3-34 TaxID=3070678 RepID=UPI0027DF42EF|nr:TnsD family Tn7-like transposition protein [Neobacillus sp. PS3-34]WML50244.1 TnsD family Tn7-like transposition protein [Neobacillus sp. PS3-34]
MGNNGEKKNGVTAMIFFPNLYKDELLFSVLARFYQYSGDVNKKHFMFDLFDSSTTCASTIFPTNLEKLCESLPSPNAYSSDYFINNHTLLPYYSPFITNDRENKLRLIMKNEDGTNIFMSSGRTASTVKNEKKLKYCILCVDEEKQTQGECYWHRTHQIEGVKVCPIHNTWLIESSNPFTERKHKHEYISLEDSIRDSDLISLDTNLKIEFKHFLYVAEQTDYLLNNSIQPLGLENLKNFYISKLNKQQLVTLEGRIRWKQLIPKFNEYYGKQLLDTLESYIYPDENDTWLHKLLRKPRVSCHPLRHILFLEFLGENISTMVSQIGSTSYKPFGNGPWICLNKAADHFHKPILTSCVITRDYKTGLPIGTFSCSCGFVFSRKGPDKTNEDQFKIGRIKEFGCVWKEKLADLSQKGLSLRKMAEILGVDPMTVKRMMISNVEDPKKYLLL